MQQRFLFNILGKKVKLRPYSTKQERDVLLLQQIQSDDLDFCLEESLRVFYFEEDNSIKISELSTQEKVLIFYLYRSISVGDEGTITYECNKCSEVNTVKVVFDFYERLKNENQNGIRFLDKELNADNLHEFISKEYLLQHNIKTDNIQETLDELDLSLFEEIQKNVQEIKEKINFNRILKCQRCKEESLMDCSKLQFLLNHVSEQDLIIIYEATTILVTYGYTKTDIDNMIPFERSILIDLMTKHLNEQNEGLS